MSHGSCIAVVVALFGLVTLAHAQTVVSGGGPSLQNAIDAAAVGDTLLVQAGDYDEVVVGKGLTVLCDPGVRVFATTNPSVTVNQIPAGQKVRWVGGDMRTVGVVAEFRVFFCDGVVEVEDLLTVRCITNDSSQVSFTDCEIRNRNTVDNATVAYTNCLLNRTQFCSGSVCSSLEVVANGVALVTDCTIIGPPGLSIFPASPGIYADNGTVRLSGANTSVTGGSASAPAVRFGPNGATIEVDPLVTIIGAVEGGVLSTAFVPATATVGGAAGDTVAVTTYGEPGSFAFSFAALPTPRVPTPFGELWMLPPVFTVTAGVVPASGQLAGSFVVPAAAVGESLTFQPAVVSTGGALLLGLPTVAIYR